MSYSIRPLSAATWDAFAELIERNNGIYGGCWCIGYHPECGQRDLNYREVKEDRVKTGRAHAALVFDEDGEAQGWCQYGSPDELSNLKHRREYDKVAPPLPAWRITCIFVDKRHRNLGVARAALEGALDLVARAGGGLVEAISETTVGRQAQGRFLFSATVELFEEYGFDRGRQVGKHAWIVSRVVEPACTGGLSDLQPGPRSRSVQLELIHVRQCNCFDSSAVSKAWQNCRVGPSTPMNDRDEIDGTFRSEHVLKRGFRTAILPGFRV